jgi:energy-coupling factor transport system substrate-specific component
VRRPRLHRPLLLEASLTALAVAIGYILLLIPNVEFITATIFISGYLTGRARGLIIGMVAEFLFSFFNPMGAPALPLLAAQMTAMGLTGFCGGLLRPLNWLNHGPTGAALLFGTVGLLLTVIYDLLTNLSIGWMMAGDDWGKIRTLLITGLGFSLVHWLGNTLGFALVVPPLLRRLRKIAYFEFPRHQG